MLRRMLLSPECARVLGALVEKALTTPQQYPLTLNALQAACNQTSNREPVVSYDETTVQTALDELKDQKAGPLRPALARALRRPLPPRAP